MKLFGPNAARSEAVGRFAVVMTSHSIATQVAMGILERGGNAFDAAAAAGFVHQVVEPHQCGPGGEVVIQVVPRGAAHPTVICGQGVAPAGATIERFRNLGLDMVPSVGLLAACVPGAVGGWLSMARDFGTLDIEDILAPAIYYAREGFPVYPRFLEVARKGLKRFKEWPSSAAVYQGDGELPALGTLFRNSELGATYSRLLREAKAGSGSRSSRFDQGIRAFYSGFVAETIGTFCAENEVVCDDGIRRTGMLSANDLDRWSVTYEAPVSVDYAGLRVFKPGYWSQGPVMLQCLSLLAGFDLDGTDPHGPDFVHIVTEACKLCFADREAYYGDSRDDPVPLNALLSDEYAKRRRALIGDKANANVSPGNIQERWPLEELSPPRPQHAPLPDDTKATLGAGDTCHIDIIDRWGNMVAATPSGGWLNDSPIIPTLGFPLGTRAQMFWLKDGSPSSLRPGRRPRTTLSPTVAYRDGEPVMVFGARGSDMQDQWILQFLLRYVHCELSLQEAIDALPFHSSHFHSSIFPRRAEPMKLSIHNAFPVQTVSSLNDRGHLVELAPDHEWNHSGAAEKHGDLLAAVSRSRIREALSTGR